MPFLPERSFFWCSCTCIHHVGNAFIQSVSYNTKTCCQVFFHWLEDKQELLSLETLMEPLGLDSLDLSCVPDRASLLQFIYVYMGCLLSRKVDHRKWSNALSGFGSSVLEPKIVRDGNVNQDIEATILTLYWRRTCSPENTEMKIKEVLVQPCVGFMSHPFRSLHKLNLLNWSMKPFSSLPKHRISSKRSDCNVMQELTLQVLVTKAERDNWNWLHLKTSNTCSKKILCLLQYL